VTTCAHCGATENLRRWRPDLVACEDVPRCYERRHAAHKNSNATHRGGQAAPFFDAPPGVCRWCGEPIVHGKVRQRRWHDGRLDERHCTLLYGITQGSGGARAACKLRDHEVCAWCGLDVGRAHARWEKGRQLAWEIAHDRTRRDRYDPESYVRAERCYQAWLRGNPEPTWAADHVVPLIDGGENTLANLQTLCDPCHAWKTARENRERAAARRSERTQQLTL
jgi:5-methylcytosine-specific restriction endonuclease McrA